MMKGENERKTDLRGTPIKTNGGQGESQP